MAEKITNRITLADHNLSFNEGWDKTLVNLSDLAKFTQDFFTKLNARIELSHTKLHGLKERVKVAKNKINYLPDKNVAFRIRSPLKFIQPYKFKIENQFKTLNDQNLKEKLPKMDIRNLRLNLHSASERGKLPHVKFDDFKTEAMFTAKCITQKKDPFKNNDAYQNRGFAGLGQPRNLKNAESLLLFNSNYNPYVQYEEALDKDTFHIKSSKREGQRVDESMIYQAPQTIEYGEEWQQHGGEKYNFIPEHKPMPQIHMKIDIGLSGVVDVDDFMDSEEDEKDKEFFLPSKNTGLVKKSIIPDSQFERASIRHQNNTKPPHLTKSYQTTQKPQFSANFNNSGFHNTGQPPQQMTQTTTPNTNAPPPPPGPPPNIGTAPPPPPIPPPNIGGPAPPPPPGLPPPDLGIKKKGNAPPKKSGGGGKMDLLSQIQSFGGLKGLRKEKAGDGVKKGKRKGRNPNQMQKLGKGKGGKMMAPPKKSHMDLLREQIARRFNQINKPKPKQEKKKEKKEDNNKQSQRQQGNMLNQAKKKQQKYNQSSSGSDDDSKSEESSSSSNWTSEEEEDDEDS